MNIIPEQSLQPTLNPASSFARSTGLVYGTTSYLIFLGTFLYAIGFVSDLIVPKTIDSGATKSFPTAMLIDLALLTVFAVQHSGMARRGFKRALNGICPAAVERSTYVLCASLALILLFTFWQPMPTTVWSVSYPAAAMGIAALSSLGWLIVLYSSFLISHFELFGLKQVTLNFVGKALPAIGFHTPGLYRFVRHPIYLGFIIAFWATPTMTIGHLLFAFATTAYIFVGIALEERDLITTFGDEYRHYRSRVAMLLPRVF